MNSNHTSGKEKKTHLSEYFKDDFSLPYIDIHTHSQNPDFLSIVNLFPGQEGLIAKKGFYSIGLHPWYIDNAKYHEQMNVVKKLAEHDQVLAIGETGPDKFAKCNFDLQVEIFKQHLVIAEKVSKPIIIHAVKSYNELVQLKKETQAQIPWIIHGFNSKPEVAKMLLDHGMYLSFGKEIRNENSNACEGLAQISSGRFFLETDDAELEIGSLYEVAAKVRSIGVATLKKQLVENFRKSFLHHG